MQLRNGENRTSQLMHFRATPPPLAIDHDVTAGTAANQGNHLSLPDRSLGVPLRGLGSRVERRRHPGCDWFIVRSSKGPALRLLGALPSPVAAQVAPDRVDLLACPWGGVGWGGA